MINLSQPSNSLVQLFAAKHDEVAQRYYDLTIVLVSVALLAIGFIIVIL